MKITKEDSRPREVTLTIEMDAEDVEPYLQRAYRRVVQRLNIPGFRKGKAPRSLVERYVGREGLLREALEFMIPEAVGQAVEQEAVEAFDQPDVELEAFDPPKIKAVVPLTPDVELGEYTSLRVELEPVEVTEEQVDGVIERFRYDLAPWEPVERPVQFGDLVTLDLEGTVEGRRVVNDTNVDFVPAKDNPLPLPGFSTHLEGLKAGETKEFTLTIPEEHTNPDLRGKECRFKVTVHGVKTKNLPEVNDEFARSVGEGYESLAALRDKVRERLRADLERQARSRLRDQALGLLLEQAKIELPETVVQREADHLLHEQEEALRERGLTLEQYLRQLGKTHDEMVEEFKPRAVERLRRSLVIRKLAEAEGLTVTDEDLDRELRDMGGEANQLARAFSSPQGRRSLASILLTRRVMERLERIATGDGAGEGKETPTEERVADEAASGGEASKGGTE